MAKSAFLLPSIGSSVTRRGRRHHLSLVWHTDEPQAKERLGCADLSLGSGQGVMLGGLVLSGHG